MQVDLEKEFELPGSAAQGWEFLQNIPGVASCMPGAEITDTIDENNYKGKVKMKIGPAAMAFAGDIVISNIDAQKRELNLLGKGQDSKGSSSAFSNGDRQGSQSGRTHDDAGRRPDPEPVRSKLRGSYRSHGCRC
jgi:carbon monoxide dehydrogenase subunit G